MTVLAEATVGVNLDLKNVKRDARAAGRMAGQEMDRAIKREIRDISRTKIQIDADSKRAAARIADLKSRLQHMEANLDVNDKQALARVEALKAEIKRVQDYKIRVDVNAKAATARIAELKAELDRLDDQTVHVKADTSKFKRSMADGQRELGAFVKLTAALAAPAAIPVLNATAAAVGALIAPMAAAGVGAAGFAAITVSSWKQINKANKDLKKGDAEAFNKLTYSQQEALAASRDLGAMWKQVVALNQPATLRVNIEGLQLARKALPAFTPIIQSADRGFSNLIGRLDDYVGSPAWGRLVDTLGRQAGPAIDHFGGLLVSVVESVGNAATRTETYAPRIYKSVDNIGNSLKNFTGSDRFSTFMAHAAADVPLVTGFFKETAKVAGGLVVALEPLGRASLRGLTGEMQSLQQLGPSFKDAANGAANLVDELAPVAHEFTLLAGTGILSTLSSLLGILNKLGPVSQTAFGALAGAKLGKTVVGMVGLGKAAGAVNKAAGGGAGAAGALGKVGKAVSFLGPVGIAAGIGLGIVSSALGRQKKAAAEAERQSKETAQAMTASFNVLDPKTFSVVDQAMAGVNEQTAQLNKEFQDALGSGGSFKSFLKLAGQGAELERLHKNLDEIVQVQKQAKSGWTGLSKATGLSGDRLTAVAQQAGVTQEEILAYGKALRQAQVGGILFAGSADKAGDQGAKLAKKIGEARLEAAAAANPTAQYAAAIRTLSDASASAGEKIPAAAEAIDLLRRKTTGTRDASINAGIGYNTLAGSLKDFTSKAQAGRAAQQIIAGDLGTAGEKTLSFASNLSGLTKTYDEQYKTIYEVVSATKGEQAARVEVGKAYLKNNESLGKLLMGMGLTREQARKLIQIWSKMPKEVSTEIKTKGQIEAQKKAQEYQKTIADLKNATAKGPLFHVQFGKAKQDADAFQKHLNGIHGEMTLDVKKDVAKDSIDALAATRFNATIGVQARTDAASRAIASTAHDRTTNIIAKAGVGAAEGALGKAARTRTSIINAQASVGGAVAALGSAAKNRTSIINAQANVGGAIGALASAAAPRTAQITAVAEVGGAISALGALTAPRTATVYVRTVGGAVGGAGSAKPRAKGGSLSGWGLVGEEGPELIKVSGNATVYPHGRSMRMLGQAGSAGIAGYAAGGRIRETPTQQRKREQALLAREDATRHTRASVRTGVNSAQLRQQGELMLKTVLSGYSGHASVDQIRDATSKVVAAIAGSFTGKKKDALVKAVYEQNNKLQSLAIQRDKISEKLQKFQAATSEGITQARQFGSVTNFSEKGQGGVVGAITGMNKRWRAILNFDKNLKTLAKRGVSGYLIAELANAGPEEAGWFAEQLAHSSKARISQINRASLNVRKASAKYGKTFAAATVGGNAAKDFVTGLQQQRARLATEMSRAAYTFGVGVANTLKNAGIAVRAPKKKRALGGWTTGATLVGERGPEIASFRRPTYVSNARQTAQLMRYRPQDVHPGVYTPRAVSSRSSGIDERALGRAVQWAVEHAQINMSGRRVTEAVTNQQKLDARRQVVILK